MKFRLKRLIRQISLDKGIECVAISAIQPKTLNPLFEKIGEMLSRNLNLVAVANS